MNKKMIRVGLGLVRHDRHRRRSLPVGQERNENGEIKPTRPRRWERTPEVKRI